MHAWTVAEARQPRTLLKIRFRHRTRQILHHHRSRRRPAKSDRHYARNPDTPQPESMVN
jgi:hypothetical protein